MRFSIIVPVYNVEKYIEKCINSLLHQDFDDYEIIIVDDGTKDKSGELADSYAIHYPEKIRVIHQENKGLGGARNTGIDVAKGEYLLFVDSDDYVSNHLLRTVNRCLLEHDIDILKFNVNNVTKQGKLLTTLFSEKNNDFRIISKEEFIVSDNMACNKVYRRNLFIENEIRFPENIFYEDLATIPMFAIHTNSIGKINTPLYYYVDRKDSIMNSTDITKILQITLCMDRVNQYFRKNKQFEVYHNELEWLAIYHVLYGSIKRILIIKYEKKSIKQIEQYIENRFPQYRNNLYLNMKSDISDSKEFKAIILKKYRYVQIKFLGKMRMRKKAKIILTRRLPRWK